MSSKRSQITAHLREDPRCTLYSRNHQKGVLKKNLPTSIYDIDVMYIVLVQFLCGPAKSVPKLQGFCRWQKRADNVFHVLRV